MRWIVVTLLLAATPARAGLYEDLGEKPGIVRITDGTLRRSLADPRIADRFTQADLPRLRLLLAAHICRLVGGPCSYPGRTMTEAHEGLHLRRRHLNALVENLQEAMDEQGVPFATQNQLLARLIPLEPEVVQP